jgi:hypothetical protein
MLDNLAKFQEWGRKALMAAFQAFACDLHLSRRIQTPLNVGGDVIDRLSSFAVACGAALAPDALLRPSPVLARCVWTRPRPHVGRKPATPCPLLSLALVAV